MRHQINDILCLELRVKHIFLIHTVLSLWRSNGLWSLHHASIVLEGGYEFVAHGWEVSNIIILLLWHIQDTALHFGGQLLILTHHLLKNIIQRLIFVI